MSLCIAPPAPNQPAHDGRPSDTQARQVRLIQKKWALAGCIALTIFAAIVPFTRAWFLTQLCYNEGWNIYNASMVAGHQLIYAQKFNWTSNNYPMLSFAVMAYLHRFTHEYLFTARALSLLSLLGCVVLTGAMVQLLTRSRRAAVLAGLFCLAVFCASADHYVGMDDPQMFSQVFYLGGLYVALRGWKSDAAMILSALLFVVGGCIKHNLIDFPLAVLVAVAMVSMRRASVFAISGSIFLSIGIALNIHYGGPYFLHLLLLPRSYSVLSALEQTGSVLGPLVLPLGAAAWMARQCWKEPRQRTLSLLLIFSFLIGGGFSGGAGVSTNAFFSVMLAMAMLLGLLAARMEKYPWRWKAMPRVQQHLEFAPLVMFAWLMIPLMLCGNWNPVAAIGDTAKSAELFKQEVAVLENHPGPTLCESLLSCYYAGKPYVYDPFNATRLEKMGKLDSGVMVNALRDHEYAAVQLEGPIDNTERRDRFTPEILEALQQSYTPAMENKDGEIYLPRVEEARR